MTKQEQLDSIFDQKRPSSPLAAFLAIFATLFTMGGTAKGDLGDQWILPIHHKDGGGWVQWSGAGYDGTDAFEAQGMDPVRRVYWALGGLSTSNTVFPTTTEQYTIEWFQPTTGATAWQPIESQFHGIIGETYPNDPSIPWAGSFGTSHQYIGSQGTGGGAGTWVATGPGPHTPNSTNYNAGDNGIYMWLTRGSWLYAKWDFGWSIDHTWSALRLTQVTTTRPVCEVTFVSQPVGRAAVVGSTVSFSATAHTTTGVTNYQWQFAGSPIPGATNNLFVLNSVQATNFGAYAVVVGNGLCSIPSQTAQLTQAVRPSFFPSRLNGTTISMSFPTELGPVYVVEYKDTLDDATWQVLNTLNGTGYTELVTDTTANSPTRFYRIRMQ